MPKTNITLFGLSPLSDRGTPIPPVAGDQAMLYTFKPTTSKDVFEVQVINDLAENSRFVPLSSQLHQNYPNPFNPLTVISWQLAVNCHVELTVYNLLGQKVATLVSRRMNPGNYTYDFSAKTLASGVYYYQIKAGDFQDVKKMILLR